MLLCPPDVYVALGDALHGLPHGHVLNLLSASLYLFDSLLSDPIVEVVLPLDLTLLYLLAVVEPCYMLLLLLIHPLQDSPLVLFGSTGVLEELGEVHRIGKHLPL